MFKISYLYFTSALIIIIRHIVKNIEKIIINITILSTKPFFKFFVFAIFNIFLFFLTAKTVYADDLTGSQASSLGDSSTNTTTTATSTTTTLATSTNRQTPLSTSQWIGTFSNEIQSRDAQVRATGEAVIGALETIRPVPVLSAATATYLGRHIWRGTQGIPLRYRALTTFVGTAAVQGGGYAAGLVVESINGPGSTNVIGSPQSVNGLNVESNNNMSSTNNNYNSNNNSNLFLSYKNKPPLRL